MSSTDGAVLDAARLPTFDLAYGVDDPDEPTTVTVYDPEAEDRSTAWISVDAAHAVPLEYVA